MARPRMPEGASRNVVLSTRVKSSAGDAFRAECKRRNMSEADAIREALGLWMKEAPQ